MFIIIAILSFITALAGAINNLALLVKWVKNHVHIALLVKWLKDHVKCKRKG
jgi:hypothetical protein